MSRHRRFQFGLRTLFLVNIALALAFGVIRAIHDEKIEVAIFLAPGLWLFAILPVIVLTALGDACDGRRGALIGAIVSGVLYCGLAYWGFEIFETRSQGRSLIVTIWKGQCVLAILLTVGGVILSVLQSRREETLADNGPARFLQRLSSFRQTEKPTESLRWKRKNDLRGPDEPS